MIKQYYYKSSLVFILYNFILLCNILKNNNHNTIHNNNIYLIAILNKSLKNVAYDKWKLILLKVKVFNLI